MTSGLKGASVLVTGGTGFLGSHLIERLVSKENAQVRVLARDFRQLSRAARFDIEVVEGNISDADAVKQASKGCSAVFHCAYDFSGGRRSRWSTNLDGTDHVARAALKQGARLLHVSTIDVYGPVFDSKISETTSKKPLKGDVYSETKYRAEEKMLWYHRRHGLDVSIVQPTVIYGPFSKAWTIAPTRQLLNGRVVLIEGGTGVCNAVYVDDVIDGMLLAFQNTEASGQTFLLSGPDIISWKDFYGAYEKILGLSSTVSMSLKELHRMHRGNLFWDSSRTTLKVLRDPVTWAQLRRIPAIPFLFGLLMDYLPTRIFGLIRDDLLQLEAPQRAGSEQALKPILYPDTRRAILQTSKGHVDCAKAQQVLGFAPKFNFERGMAKVHRYLEWAGFLDQNSDL